MVRDVWAKAVWLTKAPSRLTAAALIAAVVLILTILGALNDVPVGLRATAQAAGTLCGVYLGSQLQRRDDESSIEGAGRSALANLVALAESIKRVIAANDEHRLRLSSQPPPSIAGAVYTTETILSAVDAQARMLLTQAEAAAAVWMPYVKDPNEFVAQLDAGSGVET